MVTLILSFVGIAVSLPLGILLALGRRSQMPVIKTLCVGFIEIIRGVPLITVLFMANVMLPLFLPTGWTIDNFFRALVGVALFAGALFVLRKFKWNPILVMSLCGVLGLVLFLLFPGFAPTVGG